MTGPICAEPLHWAPHPLNAKESPAGFPVLCRESVRRKSDSTFLGVRFGDVSQHQDLLNPRVS
jgi:hypothetical protein